MKNWDQYTHLPTGWYYMYHTHTQTHTHTHGRYPPGLMIYHQVYITVNHVFLFFWYHVFCLTHRRICSSNVLSVQISYVEILMHKVTVLRGGAFGTWWGHEGGSLLSGTDDFTKETPQSSLALLPYRGTIRRLWPRRGPSLDHVGILTLDFQPPELWEIHFCCLQVIQGMVLLQHPYQTKTSSYSHPTVWISEWLLDLWDVSKTEEVASLDLGRLLLLHLPLFLPGS